jgi:glucose/arabinose dehydrogenase
VSKRKRERIVVSYMVPDGTVAHDVIKTRRADLQVFSDGRLMITDGRDTWMYHRVWRVTRKGR